MPPENKPLLLLPKPVRVSRLRPPGGGSEVSYPPPKRQKERLGGHFSALESSFLSDRTRLSQNLDGAEPEHVIVFETVGTIDEFHKAVKGIDGLEWLVEFDGDEIEENEDFFRPANDDGEIGHLSRRLYLVMSNRRGMSELLSMWRSYCRCGASAVFGRGKAKWKHLFKQLYDLRLWNAEDRLLATGLKEDWQSRVSEEQGSINVEIELWYRNKTDERLQAQASVTSTVIQTGGRVLTSYQLEGIRYHAVLVSLPIATVENLIKSNESIELAKADPVMFFRPTGQSVIRTEHLSPQDQPIDQTRTESMPNSQEPFVALLDGIPVENHTWIRNRITVDDPDGISAQVASSHRHHGTAMASLILNGDTGKNEACLERPIYIRPIMTAKTEAGITTELIPEDKLSVDVVHSSLLRMLRGTPEVSAAAPSVKVINFSIGEKYRPFVHQMSPLARLLDWLAFEFNVLFVVSAGNHHSDLAIPLPGRAIEELSVQNRQQHALLSMARETMTKRILSPADSINAISVGASNFDNSTFQADKLRIQLFESPDLPNIYSAFGLGFRNSVKPDVMAPGGRQLFSVRSSDANASIWRPLATPTRAPGQQVASPIAGQGSTSGVAFLSGTSNATAIVTRLAAKTLEVLGDISENSDFGPIPEEYWPCLTKALITHGAAWNNAKALLQKIAPAGVDSGRLKNWITRFLGYGSINEERSLFCEGHRATTLAYGRLNADSAHAFELPIPNGLSGTSTVRRLTITLAWLTPIDSFNRRYRKAQLWFSGKGVLTEDPLRVSRKEVDWQTTRRGTLQHEIFEGEEITTFGTDESLKIIVSCKADAGKLEESVRYGLAVTIESADRNVVTVYDEVRAAIRARARVQAR